MKQTFRTYFPIFALLSAVLLGYLCQFALDAYYTTVLSLIGVNIVLAVSLNLVNGFTGQFSMGHVGFMAIGAYFSAWITTVLPQSFPALQELFNHSLFGSVAFLAVMILSGLVAAIVGAIVGIPSLRLKGDYLAIVTLGFGEIIRIFILNQQSVGGARGLGGIPELVNLPWIFAVCVLSCLFIQRLLKSSLGKQFMAVRDDETATLAMGLSTTKIKVKSFIIGSFFAGVAGVLFAHQNLYLNPATFNFNYSFQVIAMVVLGGMGSLSGSIVAAIVLTASLELLRPLQTLTGLDLRMVIYALILIVMMLTRPEGLFGHKEIWNFFRKKEVPA